MRRVLTARNRSLAALLAGGMLLAGCQMASLAVQPSLMPSAQSMDKGKRSVIGRVYDENDMPVHGNTVTATMVDPTQHFANGQSVYVARIDQGDFGLANLTPPCTFTVTVDLPGYQPETQSFTLTEGGAPVVRGPVFHLKRLGR